MLVKTRVVNGVQYYRNAYYKDGKTTYGKEGPLNKMEQFPSVRNLRRHPESKSSHNNRKATAGRLQQVLVGGGRYHYEGFPKKKVVDYILRGRTIFHETRDAIFRKSLVAMNSLKLRA